MYMTNMSGYHPHCRFHRAPRGQGCSANKRREQVWYRGGSQRPSLPDGLPASPEKEAKQSLPTTTVEIIGGESVVQETG